MKRTAAKKMAEETLAALMQGHYTTPSGTVVPLLEMQEAALEGTITYLPDSPLPRIPEARFHTRYSVANESTFEATERLAEAAPVIALNFASAKNPGGGFLGGAVAQEECLCRASGLYPTIQSSPMYGVHFSERGFYTHSAIYSPNVPVLRRDDGTWLEALYRCSFITCAAVNAGIVPKEKSARVRQVMKERIDVVLRLMAGHGYERIVLGAWGCEVFRNHPVTIADLFQEALRARFHGVFAEVHFAVLSRGGDQNFEPFRERFGL
ncbi:MAG: TIGR02452 family protein [Fimbriiglobus sp.]